MSSDDQAATDPPDIDDDGQLTDELAGVDAPDEMLHDDDLADDQPAVRSPYPDEAEPVTRSPYPDEAPAQRSPYPDEADADTGPEGWGPDDGGSEPSGASIYPAQVAVGVGAAAGAAAPARTATVYDVADRFEAPEDLPPWYEDEYYDDRDWDRLPRRGNTMLRVVGFLTVLLIVGLVAYRQARGWIDDQLYPPGEPGEELVIEIPAGATTNDIARILGDEDIVANSTVFRYWLRFEDSGDYQAGIYRFRTNSDVDDVKDILEAGPEAVEDTRTFITIPEGLTVAELQDSLLAQLPRFDPNELQQAIADVRRPALFETAPLENSEGFLFPETFDVDDTTDADELGFVTRMVNQFDIVAEEVRLADAQELVGVTPYQALIIASLIEEEALLDEERALMAQVMYNRLELGTPLGIDATIVYLLGGDRELSTSDLETDSPYNTRIYPGLPPTPITSPSRESLIAALNPSEGDLLYYVRTDENGPGSHTFTTNQADFDAAVQICIERDLGCG